MTFFTKRCFDSEKARLIIGLALLILCALAPSVIGVLNGSWPFSDDAVAWFAPARQWARASLASGVLPLWNPHLFLGMPFLGNGQTAVLYPPNIIYWILPIRWALLGDAFLHGVLLGCGGYFLARTLERSRSASWLCAICLMLGNSVAAHLYVGHMTWHAARAYLPWEIAVLILYLRDAKQRYAVALAVLFALQFYSGYPPYVVWSLAWCAIFLLAWHFSQPKTAHAREKVGDAIIAIQTAARAWPRHLLLAGVLLLLLSATALLPFREMSRLSAHGVGLSFSQAVVPSSTLAGWARLALPNFFGGNHSAQWSLLKYPHEEAAYIGFIPLLLALGAPLWLKRSEAQLASRFDARRFGFVLWAILPLSMLLALGDHTPLYRFVFDAFPPLRLFRAPARWMEIWYFAACVLAAFSFDAVRNCKRNLESLMRALIFSTVLFLIPAVFIGFFSPSNFWLESAQWNTNQIIRIHSERVAYAEYLRVTALISCFSALGISLLSVFLIRRWQSGSEFLRARWQAGLIALIALDILLPFWASARLISPTDSRSQWPPAIAASHVRDTRWISMFTGDDVNFGLNQGLPLKIDSLGGYDPLASSQFFDFAGAIEGRKMWSSQYQPTRFDPLWRVAGVTHVYISGSHPFIARLRASGAKLAAQFGVGKDTRQLWRLNNSASQRIWPRYYLTSRVVRAPFEKHLSLLKKPANEPFVVLAPNFLSAIPNGSMTNGRIVETRREDNIIHLKVETSSPQILVQSEALAPGWRAWVNGREAKIERANFLFRGVQVPAGKSRIAIVYDNATFRFAIFLTLCGVALLAGVLTGTKRNLLLPRRAESIKN